MLLHQQDRVMQKGLVTRPKDTSPDRTFDPLSMQDR